MKALEVNNVNVKLNGSLVLEDINLQLDEGEFLGVIGPNGAGKTTLLKVIIGLIEPDSGTVKICGKNVMNSRGMIGYVPQFNTFDSDYPISVKEVVGIGLLGKKGLLSSFGRGDYEAISGALSKVKMESFIDRNINDLSGGEVQRVLIARALVSDPRVLLLDEPTASVDSFQGELFYELLSELNKDITIILVSHDIGAISRNVKKIACLNKKLVFHDSKEISREMLESTYKCPVDLIAHGVPHRVLDDHNH